MSTFAVAFKEHVRRLSRKEIRANTTVLRRSSAAFRRDIAALKRQVQSLQKDLKRVSTLRPVQAAPVAGEAGIPEGARFSARSVRAQRKRLGLSAAKFGKLAGVSGLTIYHWESGKARPRQKQLAGFLAIRGIGKREAAERLAAAQKTKSRK